VEERRLGPVVGLGTWHTFRGDVQLARAVADAAFDVGARVFDTSPMYGEAERSLALAFDGRRDEAVVATKIWTPNPHEARRQYRNQLKCFGGRVDVEQVHNLVAWSDHLPWLEDEREAGRVGRIGVTHYSKGAFPELARALRTRRFDAVQLPYNSQEREVERELLPLAAELAVPVLVMVPLGSGRLVARAPAPEQLEPLRPFGIKTWAQALLKWVLSDTRVDVVLPATKRPERVRENAKPATRRGSGLRSAATWNGSLRERPHRLRRQAGVRSACTSRRPGSSTNKCISSLPRTSRKASRISTTTKTSRSCAGRSKKWSGDWTSWRI
jgi:aryl-alcohol dehydrogenase-like predicted oxidoreductase